MSKDTCIKANTYCPVHKGIVGADCWHDSKDFSVPRTDWKQVDEINTLREQVEKLTEESVVLRASSRSKLETISSLELQVEKLTKERDAEIARNRPLQSLIKLTEETKSFLLKKSEENKEAVKQLDSERQANALLTEELAALAEQNEKMRKVLLRLACLGNGDQYGNSIGNCIAQEALSLPDLATPVLNRIKAEAYREAAEIAGPEDTYQDQWFKAKSDSCAKLRAKADELEQQCAP